MTARNMTQSSSATISVCVPLTKARAGMTKASKQAHENDLDEEEINATVADRNSKRIDEDSCASIYLCDHTLTLIKT